MLEMEIVKSKILNGVYILKPTISTDSRGTIWTSFLKDQVEKLLPKELSFKHDKFSYSKNNVLRGIHGDHKSWKLVTAVYGDIWQVVADMRETSPTYLNWEKYNINSNNQRMILLPPGMGNAYYVLSNHAVYHYKLAYLGEYLDAADQFSVKWNDDRLNVDWNVEKPLLSDRDNN